MSRPVEKDVKGRSSVREGKIEKSLSKSNGFVGEMWEAIQLNPVQRRMEYRRARLDLSPSSSSSNGQGSSSPPNPRPSGSHIPADDLALALDFRGLTIGGNNNGFYNRHEQSLDGDRGYRNFENPGLYECFNGSDVARYSWLQDSRDSISSLLTNSSPTFGTINNGYNDSKEFQFGGPFTGDNPVWSTTHIEATLFDNQFFEKCHRKLGDNVGRPLHDDRPRSVMRERAGALGGVAPVLKYNQALGCYEATRYEDSYIVEGRCLNPVINENRGNGFNSQNNGLWSGGFNGLGYQYTGVAEYGLNEMAFHQRLFLEKFRAMASSKDFVYLMAKDQGGCRNLQKVFDEGNCEDVKLIFEGVIDHIVELSTDPFGNYLVQKLLDVCTREDRRQIVHLLTAEPGELLTISLNTHGTRVVQKLIETSKDWRCTSSLIMALKPSILNLVKDLNGNHVLQSCLKCLRSEENEFIFDAATKFSVEIATHRHGCCVMQKCIERSMGNDRYKLLSEISKHALLLAADPYGNYVIQFIMDQNIQYFTALLITQFTGHYVRLSTLKCGSHVVEKFLKEVPQSRQIIVQELIGSPKFEDLLQDPFANYVIQSALNITKGSILHDLLVRRVRPHSQSLQASPYCKKILSQTMPRR